MYRLRFNVVTEQCWDRRKDRKSSCRLFYWIRRFMNHPKADACNQQHNRRCPKDELRNWLDMKDYPKTHPGYKSRNKDPYSGNDLLLGKKFL